MSSLPYCPEERPSALLSEGAPYLSTLPQEDERGDAEELPNLQGADGRGKEPACKGCD